MFSCYLVKKDPVATVAPCDTCAGSQTKLRHAAMGQSGVTYQDDLGVTLNERARYFSFVLQHVSLEHLRHFGVFFFVQQVILILLLVIMLISIMA